MLEIVFPFRGTTYYCGSIAGVGPVQSSVQKFLTLGHYGHNAKPPHPSFWSLSPTIKTSFNIYSEGNLPPVVLEEPLPAPMLAHAKNLIHSIQWYHGASYRQRVVQDIEALTRRSDVRAQEQRMLAEAENLREQFISLWMKGLASIPHVVLEYTKPKLDYGNVRANQN